MWRGPDSNSYANTDAHSYTDAHSDTNTYADTDANTDTSAGRNRASSGRLQRQLFGRHEVAGQ